MSLSGARLPIVIFGSPLTQKMQDFNHDFEHAKKIKKLTKIIKEYFFS